MVRLSLTPEVFSLVRFDAGRLGALAEEAADAVGLDDVEVAMVVDEELPHPLTGSYVDVDEMRRVSVWFSGGTFESGRHQGQLDEDVTRAELAGAFLRARDRIDGSFAAAPADDDLTEAQRALWDVYTDGRLDRTGGFQLREPRRRYVYRLACGFSDAADAVYDQVRRAPTLTWEEVAALAEHLAALDPRGATKRTGGRRESLRSL